MPTTQKPLKTAKKPTSDAKKPKLDRQTRKFIAKLEDDYPQFSFQQGEEEQWSPKTQTISYNPSQEYRRLTYGTLHELAHALLGHTDYQSDIELIRLEAKAWELAAEIGKKYSVNIDFDHIQNCLDTYRDWLHGRSKCPTCGVHTLQDSPSSYKCHNCGSGWRVSSGKFVRSYRKKT